MTDWISKTHPLTCKVEITLLAQKKRAKRPRPAPTAKHRSDLLPVANFLKRLEGGRGGVRWPGAARRDMATGPLPILRGPQHRLPRPVGSPGPAPPMAHRPRPVSFPPMALVSFVCSIPHHFLSPKSPFMDLQSLFQGTNFRNKYRVLQSPRTLIPPPKSLTDGKASPVPGRRKPSIYSVCFGGPTHIGAIRGREDVRKPKPDSILFPPFLLVRLLFPHPFRGETVPTPSSAGCAGSPPSPSGPHCSRTPSPVRPGFRP